MKLEPKDNLSAVQELNTEILSEVLDGKSTEWLSGIKSENKLAELFAYAENRAWYIEDNEYDYKVGTEQHKNACDETNKWFAIADKLREMIFSILRSENVIIPEKKQITVLIPFMERNGFSNNNGWWEPMQNI